MGRRILALGAVLSVAATVALSAAHAQDVPTIRFGRQTAAEDNLWLMLAKPELAPNLGKAYKIEWSQFRASDAAFKGFEAGQADMVSTSASAGIAAATQGLEMKLIASLSRESDKGAKTEFLAKKDGGPATIADLKGKTIGIIGYRSGVELWAREALRKSGLNPDRDINWAVVPFPAIGDAVRAGKIDVGGAPDVFAMGELAKGDLKVLFTSKTGMPFDEELIVLIARPSFLKEHPAAVKVFLSDLVAVTAYYQSHLKEARQALLDAKLVGLPPQVYFNVPDYVRDPGLRPSIENMTKQQDVLVSSGFQEKPADLKAVVDPSYLPAN
jgi:ABC-type nitrate/sulfonate/bicarbonate transport system substrate-binding protein